MGNEFNTIMDISASGLTAQSTRMRVIAENLANASTTPATSKQQPYQRQVVTFRNEFDKAQGAHKVKVSGITHDKSAFGKKFDPASPAADKQGYVQTPNVRPLMETMDMQEAQRSYEANLAVVDASRTMMMRTMDLLK